MNRLIFYSLHQDNSSPDSVLPSSLLKGTSVRFGSSSSGEIFSSSRLVLEGLQRDFKVLSCKLDIRKRTRLERNDGSVMGFKQYSQSHNT